MKKLKAFSLAWKILLSFLLGVLLGSYLYCYNFSQKWLIFNSIFLIGEVFIRLIKMIMIPIVISTLIVGIADIGNVKQLGRIGIKTIFYFELITTIAIVIGIVLANFFKPGVGVTISNFSTLDVLKYKNIIKETQHHSYNSIESILSLIPTNIFSSLAKGEILPIIFFSIFFGLGIASLPTSHRDLFITIFRSISEIMFKVTNTIINYAPIIVFSLISNTIANFGFPSLLPLAKLVLLVHFSILFFALVVLGIVARMFGLRILVLIRILKDELILAYSTASSESVLPNIIKKMEEYGAPASISNFVISTGYSFNLDGSTLYQSIAAIFITQMYDVNLSFWQEIMLILTLMITSKGIAGIPGVSFVVLLTTLDSIGIPTEGIVFISGIDRILDMARTSLNVLGNSLAVLVISKLEKNFDQKKSLRYERKILN